MNSSYVFSCTCKAESVIHLFPKESERRKAIEWFREHGITRVWVETFRHGYFAEEDLLRRIKTDFEQAGIETWGAICPTTAQIQSLVNCSADHESHTMLARIAEVTARLFDTVILDDFLFTSCTCDACTTAKGTASWADFRCDFKLDLERQFLLEPARRVNPRVKFFLKYPCWYDGFYDQGYDVVRESALFGHTWIGTETRDPDDPAGGCVPQTQASWIQGWANDVTQGTCGGGWIDPLGTHPDVFVEQARQTILGGAKELLLHCYDYLGTESPGIAIHGNGSVPYGRADAEAFRLEKDGLRELARLLQDAEPEGILAPRWPNVSAHEEGRFMSFLGMLGIPILPAASLKDSMAECLGLQSAPLETLDARIRENQKIAKPTLLTAPLARSLGMTCPHSNVAKLEPVSESMAILDWGSDFWNLMELPPDALTWLRTMMLRPFGLHVDAPTRVSLHLYRKTDEQGKEKRIIAIENFNDIPVTVTLRAQHKNAHLSPLLALPRKESCSILGTEASLGARSLLVCTL